MNPDPLDRLLSDYAQQSVPLRSNASRADVWTEIERRRAESPWQRLSGWMGFAELFGRPILAASALAFAALVGVVPAAMVGHSANESRLARKSIHLEAFSARSNGLAMVLAKPLSGRPAQR